MPSWLKVTMALRTDASVPSFIAREIIQTSYRVGRIATSLVNSLVILCAYVSKF